MPNRILKECICTSDTINELSPEMESLFYRLLVQCDDFGRFDARPSIVRSRCYPLKLEKVNEKTILSWLNKLAEVELIKFYIIDHHPYLLITKWEKHQQIRAKKSKYPEPDNICNQLLVSCLRNMLTKSFNLLQN